MNQECIYNQSFLKKYLNFYHFFIEKNFAKWSIETKNLFVTFKKIIINF